MFIKTLFQLAESNNVLLWDKYQNYLLETQYVTIGISHAYFLQQKIYDVNKINI